MKNHMQLKKMLYIVVLASISIVLGLIEIPWPLAAYLKLDFSEVAILVSLYLLGTKETIAVVLIRGLVRRVFRGFGAHELTGEFLAIMASLAIILGYTIAKKILRKKEPPLLIEIPLEDKDTLIQKIWMTVLVTLMLSTILLLANFLFTTPMYLSNFEYFTVFSYTQSIQVSVFDFFVSCLILYGPFNLVKGILVMIIYLIIKPRIAQISF